MNLVPLVKRGECKPLAVDAALHLLDASWKDLPTETRRSVIAPIYCLHDINPHWEGVRSCLVPDLPSPIARQIGRLGMQQPFDLRTVVGGRKSRGVIGKTVVDIQPNRLLIIGNAVEVSTSIGIIGSRMSFAQEDTRSILQSIGENLKTFSLDPLGSSLLMGGFGAVFAFEAAYIITRLQQADPSSQGGSLIACVIVFLSVLAFLALEAFDARITAFSAWWTTRTKVASWWAFLAMLLTAPVAFFVPIPLGVLSTAIRIFGTILIGSSFLTHLGQIFFGSGLSKKTVLLWWLAMAIFACTVPLLDLIPTPSRK